MSVGVDHAFAAGAGFQLLGPVEVVHRGQRLELGRRRERLLLGLLLLEPGRVVPVPRLIDLLWELDAPPSARASLRTHVARLRTSLADCDITLAGRTDGYLAEVAPDRVDAHRFIDQVGGARLVGPPGERAAALRSALALWRGPLLADVADDRLRQRIGAGLDELRMTAVELLAEADLEAGRPDQVIADLAGPVETHPTRERPVALLMTALYRCDRQADALSLYDRTRRLLAEELGVDPGTALREVYELILHCDPSLDAPVGAAAGADAAAGAAGAVPVPRQLPRDVTNFVGREADLAQLDEIASGASAAPAIVLTTIAGTAGVGKTALAVRWAHRAAHRFPDGQLFVDMRGFDIGPPLRPLDALVQVLLALGVEPDRIPARQDEAAGLYRSLLADRRMLVVLDNAASAETVRPLLPGGAGCLVLITSRNRLSGLVAHDGARPLALDALRHTESVALLTQMIGERRAGAEPGAVAELATACGHLPLALRIAAATLVDQPRLTVAAYLERFGQAGRLAALRIEDDDRSAVGAAFDQSYDALSPATRRMFRVVSLFPAPWTAAAAAAAADMDLGVAAPLLSRLTEAHLVTAPTPGRYDMHDLIKVYAHERSRTEDDACAREQAITRAYRWYIDHADAAGRLLYPNVVRVEPPAAVLPDFPDHDAAMGWHKDERSTLIALIVRPPEGCPPRLAVVLGDALRGFLVTRRNPVDWLAVATAGLAAAEADGDARLRAAAHLNSCSAADNVGDADQSIAHAERAIEASREAGWVEGQLAGLNLLGSTSDNAGHPERAEAVLSEALRLNRSIKRYTGMATNLTNLGRLNLKLGRLAIAAEQLTEVIDLVERQNVAFPALFALSNLGETYRLLGQYERAFGCFTRAIETGRRVGNVSGEASALSNLSAMLCDLGRLDEALEAAESARAVIADVGERYSHAVALAALARVHYRRGDLVAARDLLAKVLTTGAAAASVYPTVNAHNALALVAMAEGDLPGARDEADTALRLARAGQLVMIEADALTTLAAIDARGGTAAGAHGERALALHERAGHRLGQARTLAILGRPEAEKIFADLGIPVDQRHHP